MALCFMCGALNPAATFANHRRTCASRWAKARDAAKKRNLPDDDDDPGPLPPDPQAPARVHGRAALRAAHRAAAQGPGGRPGGLALTAVLCVHGRERSVLGDAPYFRDGFRALSRATSGS